MPITENPAVKAATEESHAIIRGILSLPDRRGTIDQIAEACGLPRKRVMRRLLTGRSVFGKLFGSFWRDATSGLWTVTSFGISELEGNQ